MEVQQQQQQWIKKHNFVSQIGELLDQYLHQSTGSFALNPKLTIQLLLLLPQIHLPI
jgi:hypothetical protein